MKYSLLSLLLEGSPNADMTTPTPGALLRLLGWMLLVAIGISMLVWGSIS
jgi:hypothetical protein